MASQALLIALLWTIAAPEGSTGEFHDWYESLHGPRTGESCCGVGDCRHLQVRIADGSYFVDYKGTWLLVPDYAISDRTDNPTGDYVTCVQDPFYSGGEPQPRIICFFRAPGT